MSFVNYPDGLYRAELDTRRGPVVFGFVVENGYVVRVAPYGYKLYKQPIYRILNERIFAYARIKWICE